MLALLFITVAAHQYIIALARDKRVFILGKILVLMDRSQAVKAIGRARVIPFLRVLVIFISLHEL